MKLMAGRRYKYDLSDVIGILLTHEKSGDPITLDQIRKAAGDLYGSYEKMLIAFDSNTGSDHDMKEEYSDNSYKGYINSIKALSNVYRFADPKDVLKLSDDERRFLARKLANQLNVSRFITETLLRIYKPKKERLS
jgi:hypothetical protein